MDDYISRKELIEHIKAHCDGCDGCGEVMHCALDTPAADVVLVVRCKDCKNAHQDQFGKAYKTVGCTLLRNSCGWPIIRKENDYCSDGERVKGEDE